MLPVGQLPRKASSGHPANTDHNTPACHAVDYEHALDKALRRQLTMPDKISLEIERDQMNEAKDYDGRPVPTRRSKAPERGYRNTDREDAT